MSQNALGDLPIRDWVLNLVSNAGYRCKSDIVEIILNILSSEQSDDEIQGSLFDAVYDFDIVSLLIKNRRTVKDECLRISKIREEAIRESKIREPHTSSIKHQENDNSMMKMTAAQNYESKNTARYLQLYVKAKVTEKPVVDLIPTSVFGEQWIEKAFKCDYLNPVQSTVFEYAYRNNGNLLVCAPTGAGKTNIAMLTIVRELSSHVIKGPKSVKVPKSDSFLIVYVTPMKALATEVTSKFREALKHINIIVNEFTGDSRDLTQQQIGESHILVATPEKWDIATRRITDTSLGAKLTLLIIDEVHLLADSRGPVIEAIVARTKRQVENSQRMIRIVGLSATLPNYMDVANFLFAQPFVFGPEYRPVPLDMTLIGAKCVDIDKSVDEGFFMEKRDKFANVRKSSNERSSQKSNEELLSLNINYIAYEIVKKLVGEDKNVLVFVHSRNETKRFASLIANKLDIKLTKDKRNELARKLRKKQLPEGLDALLFRGIAVHHAGLSKEVRRMVEDLFRNGFLHVLVSTATLAWGVNLPAQAVIIKGTTVYSREEGGQKDIGILDVHQMFGRAGRPQFDSYGYAFLITEFQKLGMYSRHLILSTPIKSRVEERLADFLNAEICLGTVTTRTDAYRWAKNLFVAFTDCNIDSLIHKIDLAIVDLRSVKMVRTSTTDAIHPTHLGYVASLHYIPYKAVTYIDSNLAPDLNLSSLIACVFSSGLLDSLVIRDGESAVIEAFNKLIPIDCVENDAVTKGSYLFQAYVTNQIIPIDSLRVDALWVPDNMERIFAGVLELAVEKGWVSIAIMSLTICRMVANRMIWCDKKKAHPLLQTILNKNNNRYFVAADILQRVTLDIDEAKALEPDEFPLLLKKKGVARLVKEAASIFPVTTFTATYQPISDSINIVKVEVCFDFEWSTKLLGRSINFWLFISDSHCYKIYVAQELAATRSMVLEGAHTFEFVIPAPYKNSYEINLCLSQFLGSDCSYTLYVQNCGSSICEKFISKSPRLRPIRVSVIDPEYQYIFKFNEFNIVQSQVFFQCYHTDENLLVCAPTATGKTAIAELCLIRLLKNYPDQKVVYIAPLKSIVIERVKDWKAKFGKLMVELTGDFTPDSELISKARIIVATPEKWDAVSRGYIVRKFVQLVGLVVIDEIHLLGTDRGHIIEAIVDRMKSMPANPRFLGLSTILANPYDVGDWLDVPRRGCYNFPSELRTVPLQTYIRGFPGRHYCPRMNSMNKPLIDAIDEFSQNKPVLVFVSSRKQTRYTATALLGYASDKGCHDMFYSEEAELSSQLVKNADLKFFLSHGIGMHHAGLPSEDCKIVENLFASGSLKLLIATSTLAWGINLPSHLVVIKGTEYFDPKTATYVPYSITELQQMIGRAGRPQFDSSGVALIFCEDKRKDFFVNFIDTPFPVESCFEEHVFEHVNAEIATGRVFSMDTLIAYLRRTYLGKRLNKNPIYYNELTLEVLADRAVKELLRSQCIVLEEQKFVSTQFGRIASIFYVSHITITRFCDFLNGNNHDVPTILHLLCKAHEFSHFPVRHNDDSMINQMNVRFKTSDQAESPHTKAYYILQYYLSGLQWPVPDFGTDCDIVIDNFLRIVGSFIEVAARMHCLFDLINAIICGQMITQGYWWDESPYRVLINDKSLSKKLKSREILTLPQIIFDPSPIDSPILDKIRSNVLIFRVYKIVISDDRKTLTVSIKKVNGNIGACVVSPHFDRKTIQSLHISVGDPESGFLYVHKRVQLRGSNMKITLQSDQEISKNVWIYLLSDCYIGIDQMFPLNERKISELVPADVKEYSKKEMNLLHPEVKRCKNNEEEDYVDKEEEDMSHAYTAQSISASEIESDNNKERNLEEDSSSTTKMENDEASSSSRSINSNQNKKETKRSGKSGKKRRGKKNKSAVNKPIDNKQSTEVPEAEKLVITKRDGSIIKFTPYRGGDNNSTNNDGDSKN